MKKICIVRDDYYHPREVVDPFFDKVFLNQQYQVTKTDHLKEALSQDIDLLILANTGRNDSQEGVTVELREAVAQRVEQGMGMIFFHSGTVLIEKEDAFFQKLNSGRFITHSDGHVNVRTSVIRNVKEHPLLENVGTIEGMDEHYFCEVDERKVDILMISSSDCGSSVGAWCSEYGLGKVVVSLPGHTPAILEDKNLLTFIKNAVQWTLDK